MACKTDAKVPTEFDNMKAELEGDKAFCSIIAVAAITNQPVQKIQSLMAKHGRKFRCGTKRETTEAVLVELGYKVTKRNYIWISNKIMNRYPERHQSLMSITSHHPRRFPSAWVGQPDMLMFGAKHVAAYVDGVVCDWTIKHSMRVNEIWTLEKVA